MAETIHGVAALIRTLLARLIVAALVQDEAQAREAFDEAVRIHEAPGPALARSTGADVALDGLWSQAVAEAETPALLGEALRASPALPAACPFAIADLAAPRLDLGGLMDRIRTSAPTG